MAPVTKDRRHGETVTDFQGQPELWAAEVSGTAPKSLSVWHGRLLQSVGLAGRAARTTLKVTESAALSQISARPIFNLTLLHE